MYWSASDRLSRTGASAGFGETRLRLIVLLVVGAVGSARTQDAQETAAPDRFMAAAESDEGPLVADSGVGYIDNALLGNQLRMRYDATFDVVQPARAEFVWPVNGPFGNGPGPDTSIDYQDFSLYAESMMGAGWSLFGELPFRMINPELQDNTSGLGDANAGIKYRLRACCCTAWTAQFRVYIPTGDGDRGLGTDHASVEPGLLYYHRVSERAACYAELKDWIAVDGSPGFFGNVLRYGLGASYQINESDACHPLLGVVEFVGWTVLEGRTAITTSRTNTIFTDATGDTIVNVKLGARWRLGPSLDAYCGYGRVLTEQTWYDDTIRFELRQTF